MSCSGCGRNYIIVNKKYNLCQICNHKRLHPNEEKKGFQFKRTKIKYVRKETGERKLFIQLDGERGSNCQLCGKYIYGFSVSNYHHIKPKSTYPELRLDPNNIIKICFDCHFKIHNK